MSVLKHIFKLFVQYTQETKFCKMFSNTVKLNVTKIIRIGSE